MKKVRKAIIPAAGLGTRFLPATKAMPDEEWKHDPFHPIEKTVS